MSLHHVCSYLVNETSSERVHKGEISLAVQCCLRSFHSISSDLTHSLYNLLTESKFPRFHVSVSAYKRGNGASCCVCLQSQMLINCIRMKVEGFYLHGGLL